MVSIARTVLSLILPFQIEILKKLTLVGAGPGDPELITLKGVNALKSADVVLYDALSNKDLLIHTKPICEKIFVGKRGGFSETEQDYINELIVSKAKENNHVVRLKGGDPFVFGRGYEELVFATKHNIEVEIIPGISSCIALPELNNIPLTARGITESFWVTTGVTRNNTVSNDIIAAAKTDCTVVILMGMNNLTTIVDIFKKENKSKTPIAIIQDGSTPEEKTGIGTIETILSLVKEKELRSPAVIVIGQVVTLHKQNQQS